MRGLWRRPSGLRRPANPTRRTGILRARSLGATLRPVTILGGVAKLVKAPDFDSGIRGFESFLPSHHMRFHTLIAEIPLRQRHGLRTPDGVHGQRQPEARARRWCGTSTSRSAARRRRFCDGEVDGRAARERPRQGRLRAAVDLRADERQPDGAAGHGRRAEARFGAARHRRDPVLRLRAPGPPAALARVAISAKVVANMLHGRRGPRADDGSARRPDPGLLRHPGRQHLRRAGPARRRLEEATDLWWSRPTWAAWCARARREAAGSDLAIIDKRRPRPNVAR